jgi:DEAD/DEAH box helicase domain-containing protein
VPVTDDASPRGATEFALWEPPLMPDYGGSGGGEHGAPVRRSATAETADLLADLVVEGARTIAFVRSRRGAESVSLSARRALSEAAPELVDRVAAYRAGYLPEERRALEARLQSGDLVGVAATNALELGLDVSGLDAVVLTGWPGTVASVWQQAGRAGRAGQGALAVFVARDDPLDTYLVHHPQALFGRPVETTVLDPANPYVLGPHLGCAAAELHPLTEQDLELFGNPRQVRLVVDDLVRRAVLRSRPRGWFWTSRERPEIDIRGTGGPPVRLVESGTGRLLGTVDASSAHSQAHTGAVYLHQGESWLVDELGPRGVGRARARRGAGLLHLRPGHHRHRDRRGAARRVVRRGELRFGTVDVTHQVVAYLKKRIGSGEVLGEEPLDLPPRQLRTRAVWYTVEPRLLDAAGCRRPTCRGRARRRARRDRPAAAVRHLRPLGHRRGLDAPAPDTGTCTVFVYDGHPGGAGFSEQGYVRGAAWLRADARGDRVVRVPDGCPSCVQSPSAATATSRWTRRAPSGCCDVVLGSGLGGCRRGKTACPVRASARSSPWWSSVSFCCPGVLLGPATRCPTGAGT